jgi:NADH-quinone oxidoreductase subunit H
MRYDQFMQLGWKTLIPINLVWILAVSSMHVLRDRGWPTWKAAAIVLVPVLLVILVVLSALEGASARRRAAQAAEDEAEARLGPAFPVPPMDLRVPRTPMLVRASAPASVPDQKGSDADG